ncbi:MAG: GGDEF domain-containing phosphodiesterase [Lachnospiraceae bacterium]|nr:GGDEF domain-containing phosphodiesterase [Lachnospiraceae bacterium]
MANKKEKELGKLKKAFSIGAFIGPLIIGIIIICSFFIMMRMIGRYIIDSKIRDERARVVRMAEIYSGSASGSADKVFSAFDGSGNDYIVLDANGNVVDQMGDNTCDTENGGMLIVDAFDFHGVFAFLNFRTYDVDVDDRLEEEVAYLTDVLDNSLYVYPDSECRVLVHEADGTERVDYGKFVSTLFRQRTQMDQSLMKEGSFERFPYWIDTVLPDGRHFAGKAYFTVYFRELLVMSGLFVVIGLLFAVLFIYTFIFIIRAYRKTRLMDRLFFEDDVTDGHNWLWFYKNAGNILSRSKNADKRYAVLDIVFVNYRNFVVCHSLKEGEEMLRLVDKKIREHLRPKEIAARHSAAHFVALMSYSDRDELEGRIRAMTAELEHINSEHRFCFQIGVDRIAPSVDARGKSVRRKNVDIEKEYNNAGAARTTISGTDSAIAFFDEKMVEEQRWIDMISESQEKALKNEEFLVYYQPKYDPRTNELKGAEALIRWNSPEHGLISPGRFIPLFEQNGFITNIDHYMLKHVAADQRKWIDEGRKVVPVSVNVSRAHFIEEDLAEQIRDIVDEAGTPHEFIEIELTESAFFDDKKALIGTIEKLKDYGFTVSMDDFGSGYSSLNSLKEMPLDVLKLDADFFRNDSGERGHIVVAEAIKLAKRLDMRTVAEGVEVKEQVDFLADEGCDMIQGFYFAKPMPKDEYEQKMEKPAV